MKRLIIIYFAVQGVSLKAEHNNHFIRMTITEHIWTSSSTNFTWFVKNVQISEYVPVKVTFIYVQVSQIQKLNSVPWNTINQFCDVTVRTAVYLQQCLFAISMHKFFHKLIYPSSFLIFRATMYIIYGIKFSEFCVCLFLCRIDKILVESYSYHN